MNIDLIGKANSSITAELDYMSDLVHMACVMQGRRVGVAYYDSDTRQLFVLEIWEDSVGEFPLIDLVKFQSKASTIYTSTKTEEALLSALQRNDGNGEAPVVKLTKSSTFSYEQAWHRISITRSLEQSGGSLKGMWLKLSRREISRRALGQKRETQTSCGGRWRHASER
uniref:Uncharacterized protein n=1 Tax=Zea mays TaxID=4577 RepID=A0A804QP86_MAIZE